jgi:hypothetical protein
VRAFAIEQLSARDGEAELLGTFADWQQALSA